jgi:hypothetical protein
MDGAMPIIMSVVVLLMIAAELWKHGLRAPHHDEGPIDHIAILLMFGQIPIMFWFAAPGRRLAWHAAHPRSLSNYHSGLSPLPWQSP